MRGAVGMRNAIIYAYLSLDWERIAPVLRDRRYHAVADYTAILGEQLLHR